LALRRFAVDDTTVDVWDGVEGGGGVRFTVAVGGTLVVVWLRISDAFISANIFSYY
jgi:hypothetical protein